MKNIYMVFVISLIMLFLAGCGQQAEQPSLGVPASGFEDVEEMIVVEEPTSEVEEITKPREEETTAVPEEKETVKEIRVTAKRFEFIPNPIKVNKGDRVRLLITAIDTSHGFRLKTPFVDVDETLLVNQEVAVEFTATESGEYEFWCSIPCGSGHGGMRGKLIVE